MLHILLWIVRIAGILLGTVLGLIVLALLLILLVPVRYDAEGKKKEKSLAARARASWLLRLVRVQAVYRDGETRVTIFLFGRPFKKMRFGTRKVPDGAPAAKAGDKPAAKPAAESRPPAVKPQAAKPASSAAAPKTESKPPAVKAEEKPAAKPKAAKPASSAAAPKTESKPPAVKAEKKPPAPKPKDKPKEKPKEKPPKKEREEGIFAKLLRNVHRIPEMLTDIISAAAGTWPEGADRAAEKIDDIRKKADPWITPQMRGLYRKVLRYLLRIWRHYRPRTLKGWLRFGAGAPDLTGQLTGLGYRLIPQAGGDYSLEPDFSQKILETDSALSGHIRLCWAALAAVGLLLDRRVWKLIRRLRGKGGE